MPRQNRVRHGGGVTICGNRSWIRAEPTVLPIFIAGRPAYRIVAERELADALAKLADTTKEIGTR